MGKDCRSLKHQHFDAVRSCQVEMLCLMQGDGRAVPFPRPLPRLAQNDPNLIQWHVCHSNLSHLVGSPQGGETTGYDTNNSTKGEGKRQQGPQVAENMVELVGLEPTTSSLRTMRSPN